MSSPTFRSPVPDLQPYGTDAPPGVFAVTRPFGDGSLPQYGNHDGLDIGNKRQHDPILSAAPGWVQYAGFDSASGGAGIVVIDHGSGWTSHYAHLDEIYVIPGSPVKQGQVVGLLGSTGWVTGAHLHFGIKLNGIPLDPWPLIHSIQGDEPVYDPRDLLNQYGLQLITREGANVREKQGTSYPKIVPSFAAGTVLIAAAKVVGEPANGSIEWYETKVQVSSQVITGFVHSSAVDVIAGDSLGNYQDGYAAAKEKALGAVQEI